MDMLILTTALVAAAAAGVVAMNRARSRARDRRNRGLVNATFLLAFFAAALLSLVVWFAAPWPDDSASNLVSFWLSLPVALCVGLCLSGLAANAVSRISRPAN